VAKAAVHKPVARTWECAGCGEPWPCDPARVGLLTEYAGDTKALRGAMADEYIAAVYDIGEPYPPQGELFARFLAWCPPPRTSADRSTSTRR
jgi:hypothetical protein